MTVSVPSYTEKTWQGDGSTKAFSFQTRVLEANDLEVYLVDEDDNETLQSVSAYALTGLGDSGGVTITAVAAPTSAQRLRARRVTVPKQTVDYTNLGKVPGDTTETQLDRLAMAAQDANGRLTTLETFALGLDDDADRAEAAADIAQAAAAAAEAAAGGNAYRFSTLSIASAYAPADGDEPPYTETMGYSSIGDGGKAFYKLAVSEPSHPGKYQDASGNWYEQMGKLKTPAQFGNSLASLIAALNDDDVVDGAGANISCPSPVTMTAQRVTFIGSATVTFDTLSPTGGALNCDGLEGPYFEGHWHFAGPETQATFDAKSEVDRAVLNCAIYAEDCVAPSFKGVTGEGVQIVIRGLRCPNVAVKDFEANGFLPDVPAASTGAGSIIAPYIAGLNWVDALYLVECDDAELNNIRTDHYGNAVVMGGNSQRPAIANVVGAHLWDNCVYLSSADLAKVEGVHCDYSTGTVVKMRGSHNSARKVSGTNVLVGVTLSPYDTGAGVNDFKDMGEDVTVEDVSVEDSIAILFVDTLEIGADEVALSNVHLSKIHGKNILGTDASLIPIRVSVAKEAFSLQKFSIESAANAYALQIAGLVSGFDYVPAGIAIRDGFCRDTKAALLLNNLKGFQVDSLRGAEFNLAASATYIQGQNVWDGRVANCGADDDTSLRIDFRTSSTRVSLRDNRSYVYDAASLEVFGNTSDSPKNIGTTAPWKSGQFCLTSAGGIAVSKGASATTDWVTI